MKRRCQVVRDRMERCCLRRWQWEEIPDQLYRLFLSFLKEFQTVHTKIKAHSKPGKIGQFRRVKFWTSFTLLRFQTQLIDTPWLASFIPERQREQPNKQQYIRTKIDNKNKITRSKRFSSKTGGEQRKRKSSLEVRTHENLERKHRGRVAQKQVSIRFKSKVGPIRNKQKNTNEELGVPLRHDFNQVKWEKQASQRIDPSTAGACLFILSCFQEQSDTGRSREPKERWGHLSRSSILLQQLFLLLLCLDWW